MVGETECVAVIVGVTVIVAVMVIVRVTVELTVSVAVGVMVTVSTGVAVCVMVAGWRVGVEVAGGVTCKSSFWLGIRIEVSFNPFQVNKSLRLTL